MRKIILFLVVALCQLTTAMAQDSVSSDLDARYATDMLQPGAEAPDFIIGEKPTPLRLSDLKGHYVLLHFWASWCPDCRKDMPEMKQLCTTYISEEKGIQAVHYSFDKDTTAWMKYRYDNPVPGFHIRDAMGFRTSDVAKAYHVKWIPAMYVIDPEGKVALATVDINKLSNFLKNIDKNETFIRIDKGITLPTFKGGVKALMRFMTNNLRYPKDAQRLGIEGKVNVYFTVDVDGRVLNPHATKATVQDGYGAAWERLTENAQQAAKEEALDKMKAESLRVMGVMPRWNPGKKDGEKVKVAYTLPFTFRLE